MAFAQRIQEDEMGRNVKTNNDNSLIINFFALFPSKIPFYKKVHILYQEQNWQDYFLTG